MGLVGLLLELGVGLVWSLEFVESSALELLPMFKLEKKILGMFILPILCQVQDCFLLCVLPLWPL